MSTTKRNSGVGSAAASLGALLSPTDWESKCLALIGATLPPQEIDHDSVEESINYLYKWQGLDRPKLTFCLSPRAMVLSMRDTKPSERGLGRKLDPAHDAVDKALRDELFVPLMPNHLTASEQHAYFLRIKRITALSGLREATMLMVRRELSRYFFKDASKSLFYQVQFMLDWGLMDCLDYCLNVLGRRLDACDELSRHMLNLAWSLDSVVSCRHMCWASLRPTLMRHTETPNGEHILHATDGPVIAYSDGFAAYAVRGVSVPSELITDPKFLTVAKIKYVRNAELRRVMIELYGSAKYVLDGGGKIVHVIGPNYPVKGLRNAKLWSLPDPTRAGPMTVLELVNSTPEPDGTHRVYHLNVNPTHYSGMAGCNCHAAAASMWRHPDDPTRQTLMFDHWADYNPDQET